MKKFKIDYQDIPNALFHITTMDRWDGIKQNGLLIDAERSTVNNSEVIYLTSEPDSIVENDPEFWRHNLCLLKVEIESYVPFIQPDYEYDVGTDLDGSNIDIFAFTCSKSILPEHIHFVSEIKLETFTIHGFRKMIKPIKGEY